MCKVYTGYCGTSEIEHGLYAHWFGACRTNALYSGHIFARFNDLEDVFT